MAGLIRAGALLHFSDLVTELGGVPHMFLRRLRIPAQSLVDEDALISLRSYVHLMERVAIDLSCPDFGLRLGHRQNIAIFGALAVAIRHSRTVGEALTCTSRWLFVQSQGVSLTLFAKSPASRALAELRFEVLDRNLGISRQFVDQSLAVLDTITRHLGGSHYKLRAVHLNHEPVAPLLSYRKTFAAPVRVAQNHAALLFDESLLEVPLRTEDAMVSRLATEYLRSHFSSPQRSVADRIRLILNRSIGESALTRDRVAHMIGLHPRTMQRHLAKEGTTFEDILDDVRSRQTFRYLTETHLPMKEITHLVGLSQGSALTRGCRKWFGVTPQTVRARQHKW